MNNYISNYRPVFFTVEEIFSPNWIEYAERNDLDVWMFMDPLLLWTADRLRDEYGPTIINNYAWGGRFSQRGMRDWNYDGSASPHKMGKALDMVFKERSAQSVREEMRAYPHADKFKFINRCEDGVTWLHTDTFNVKGIYFFGGIME